MKNTYIVVFYLLLNIGSFAQKSYIPTRKTPELGSKLSYMSWNMVKIMNKAIQTGNVDSVFYHYQSMTPKFIFKSGHYTEEQVGKDSLTVRIFYPSRKALKNSASIKLPVLVYYHGGGFISGSLDMFHGLAVKLSKRFNCIVVLPEYRLAPKHPYPSAVNDCDMILEWVYQHIGKKGGNAKKVGLMGDSAGANLALVSSLKNTKREMPYPIAFQVLFYPTTTMVDTAFASRKYFMGSQGSWYVLNRPTLLKMKTDYLKGNSDRHWTVSPLYAEYDKSTPPTLIITAQCDPLRDEGELLAEKMKQSGVNVKSIRCNKTSHGFIGLYPFIRQARQSIKASNRFSKEFFNQ